MCALETYAGLLLPRAYLSIMYVREECRISSLWIRLELIADIGESCRTEECVQRPYIEVLHLRIRHALFLGWIFWSLTLSSRWMTRIMRILCIWHHRLRQLIRYVVCPSFFSERRCPIFLIHIIWEQKDSALF